MDFQVTPLMVEVRNIINSGPKSITGKYEAILTINNQLFKPHQILNIDIVRDFLFNYTDEVLMDMVFSKGTYENYIIPYKENIDISVTYTPTVLGNITNELNKPIVILKGRAILTEKSNPHFSNITSTEDSSVQDKLSIVTVNFQVIHPLLETFRMSSIGGIYRNTTGADLIKLLLMECSNKDINDVKYKIDGVDVVPKYNATVLKHISIPMGTKLSDAPDYINKNIDGIYSAGFGFYLDKNKWYLYPTYDVDRFKTAKNTLTIIKVPADLLPQLDRTYNQVDNSLSIITNRDISFEDGSDIDQLNHGNALRLTDGRNIVEDFVKVDGNKATASRASNVNEFTNKARTTGLNNVVSPGNKVTTNIFYEMSKLSKRSGSLVTVNWDYCDCSLLYPGMPVRFLMQQGISITPVYGVLLGVHEMVKLAGQGITTNKYVRHATLSIFVNRELAWNATKVENK